MENTEKGSVTLAGQCLWPLIFAHINSPVVNAIIHQLDMLVFDQYFLKLIFLLFQSHDEERVQRREDWERWVPGTQVLLGKLFQQ